MTVLLPGDMVPLASSSSIKLGPGLLPTQSSSSSLTAIRAGALGHISSKDEAYWIETNTLRVCFPRSHPSPSPASRCSPSLFLRLSGLAPTCPAYFRQYTPAPSDPVIGQITQRGAESYTVTLFSSHSATLPALSFEGATKRHKPNLRIGSLVYARVVSADRFTEPELTCVNPVTGKSDGFGDLKTTDERGERNGVAMLVRVSVGLARR